jgi:hypothetical protein
MQGECSAAPSNTCSKWQKKLRTDKSLAMNQPICHHDPVVWQRLSLPKKKEREKKEIKCEPVEAAF